MAPTTAAIEIVRAGMLTTIQDLGRTGLGRYGVSPAGPMDPVAHRLANALVGNPATAAALELTGPGAGFRFLRAQRFAIAGADFAATLDGVPLHRIAVATAAAGAALAFPARKAGARVALACAGGLVAPRWFGSAATDLGALGLGPLAPVRAGTTLAVGSNRGIIDPDNELRVAAAGFVALPSAGVATPLRYVPESAGGVSAEALHAFPQTVYRLSVRSNRTGFRFEGARLENPPAFTDPNRLSEPTAPGAIQLPPDGQPILLMADRNTTGGYPRLGHLCSADMGRAAQLWPGDAVTFVPVETAAAQAITRSHEAELRGWLTRIGAVA